MSAGECPKCGKINPPGAEKCNYCQASIKYSEDLQHLIESTGDESTNTIFKNDSDGKSKLGAWLKSIENSQNFLNSMGGKSSHENQQEKESNISDYDWVAGLKQVRQEIEKKFDTQENVNLDDLLDHSIVENTEAPEWLANLRSKISINDKNIEKEIEDISTSERPEWLKEQRAQSISADKVSQSIDTHKMEYLTPDLPPEGFMDVVSLQDAANSFKKQDTKGKQSSLSSEKDFEKFDLIERPIDKDIHFSRDALNQHGNEEESSKPERNLEDIDIESLISQSSKELFADVELSDKNESKRLDGLGEKPILEDGVTKLTEDEVNVDQKRSTSDYIHEQLYKENSGPLKGIFGILSAEKKDLGIIKIPHISTSPHIPEVQLKQAKVISEMFEDDVKPHKVVAAGGKNYHQLMRIGIFLVLIIAVTLPKIFHLPKMSLPYISPDTLKFIDVINRLPHDSPVVIATDFEPGYSGELELSFATLLNHLLMKDAHLIFLSTSVTGSVQSQRMINQIHSNSLYILEEGKEYSNFGYLPGGITGLAGLSSSMRTNLPFTVNAENPWNNSVFQNISNLTDVALVIVITDSPDVARAWLEQITPTISNVPMGFVISAQSEPIVRPYIEVGSYQDIGLISGLAGGFAYQSVINTNALDHYWQSYIFVILISLLLLLVLGPLMLILPRGKKSLI